MVDSGVAKVWSESSFLGHDEEVCVLPGAEPGSAVLVCAGRSPRGFATEAEALEAGVEAVSALTHGRSMRMVLLTGPDAALQASGTVLSSHPLVVRVCIEDVRVGHLFWAESDVQPPPDDWVEILWRSHRGWLEAKYLNHQRRSTGQRTQRSLDLALHKAREEGQQTELTRIREYVRKLQKHEHDRDVDLDDPEAVSYATGRTDMVDAIVEFLGEDIEHRSTP